MFALPRHSPFLPLPPRFFFLYASPNVQGNVIYGRVSRFKDSFNSRWAGNFIEDDMHYYKLQDGSCFDPESDIEEPEGFEYDAPDVAAEEDHSFSFDFMDSTGDGFFCGV